VSRTRAKGSNSIEYTIAVLEINVRPLLLSGFEDKSEQISFKPILVSG
jgi:hypothetical protein